MIDLIELSQAVGDLDEEKVFHILDEFLASNPSKEEIQQVLSACQQGMVVVGELFDSDDYYVADLVFAGEMMSTAVEMLKPFLQEYDVIKRTGTVLLGTVEGDLHDIGKNIFKSMLAAEGFEVYDLGVDIPPDTFVKKVREIRPQILAMSAVLSVAVNSMQKTVAALEEAGLRANIKILVGGSPVTAENCKYIGADAFTNLAGEGVSICKQWMKDLSALKNFSGDK